MTQKHIFEISPRTILLVMTAILFLKLSFAIIDRVYDKPEPKEENAGISMGLKIKAHSKNKK